MPLAANSGELMEVAAVIIHPQYKSEQLVHDVALLKLMNDSQQTEFPAIASSSVDYESREAIIMGWGYYNIYSLERSKNLLEAVVPIISQDKCKKRMGSEYSSSQMLCAGRLSTEEGAPDGVDSCQGDSGGPLLVNVNGKFTIVGLTSWGMDCGSNFFWGVYARTDVSREWILSDPAVPPYVISAPRIIGRPIVGSTLTCYPGIWGGDSSASLKIRWVDVKRGRIPGAKGLKYKLKASDRGRELSCEVRRKNARAVRTKKLQPVR